MSDTEETAKAVQEVAKTASNAIDKTAELSRFLGKVVGPAIQDLGEIAKQYTEYWKLRNALHLRDKFERVLIERGSPQLLALPLRVGLPLLDAAVTEDDENLQTLWANLLASAMTEKGVTTVTKSFVEVLRQIDVVDAELFTALHGMHLRAVVKKSDNYYINTSQKLDVVQVSVALNNLERLGLLRIHKKLESASDEVMIRLRFQQKDDGKLPSFTAIVSLTLFGVHFMRACTERKLTVKEGGELLPIEDRFEYQEARRDS